METGQTAERMPAARIIDVLVVDDERSILGVAREIIGEYGHRVWVAGNGADALLHLESEKADLIITDIMMPGMDGIELCRRIRTQHPSMPLAIMTGYSNRELLRQAEDIGILECLRKPFKACDMMAVVNRVAQQPSL